MTIFAVPFIVSRGLGFSAHFWNFFKTYGLFLLDPWIIVLKEFNSSFSCRQLKILFCMSSSSNDVYICQSICLPRIFWRLMHNYGQMLISFAGNFRQFHTFEGFKIFRMRNIYLNFSTLFGFLHTLLIFRHTQHCHCQHHQQLECRVRVTDIVLQLTPSPSLTYPHPSCTLSCIPSVLAPIKKHYKHSLHLLTHCCWYFILFFFSSLSVRLIWSNVKGHQCYVSVVTIRVWLGGETYFWNNLIIMIKTTFFFRSLALHTSESSILLWKGWKGKLKISNFKIVTK